MFELMFFFCDIVDSKHGENSCYVRTYKVLTDWLQGTPLQCGRELEDTFPYNTMLYKFYVNLKFSDKPYGPDQTYTKNALIKTKNKKIR